MALFSIHSRRSPHKGALLCGPLLCGPLLCGPLLCGPAHAAPIDDDEKTPALLERIETLQRQIAEQSLQIEALAREVAVRRGTGAPASGSGQTADAQTLDAARGTGPASAVQDDPTQAETTEKTPVKQAATSKLVQPAPEVAPAATASTAAPGTMTATSAAAAAPAPAANSTAQANAAGRANAAGTGDTRVATPEPPSTSRQAAVGKPPHSTGAPPHIAPLFEQPGVLTPKGAFVLEPGLQFGYSSSNRVALVGYTVIPALLIGLVDVREVKRNTTTATLSARTGLSNRLEVEVKVPYVYRSDATVSREIFTGTAVEKVFDTSGRHLGDAELGVRYQLNQGGNDSPYYVGALRVKSRTGRDPFRVVTDCVQRCVGPNATGTGLPLELPTGSGFYSVQPSLTWLFPSDPAVFFGSVSYLHNIKRHNVSRTVLNGEREFIGDVAPGDIAGFNVGIGLGLNEKASLSFGYDHASIGRTKQDGRPVPGAVRTQLGTLLLGVSYRLSDKRSVNVSIGAGLTRDTPDMSLTVRMPLTF